LEAKSEELARTAEKLQEANKKLTALSVQKDAFLSQVSHELRTPMTSIRSFSEILRDGDALSGDDLKRYAGIIHEEGVRLTRLLDDLLDLSVLENGQVSLNMARGPVKDVVARAMRTAQAANSAVRMTFDAQDVTVATDMDRLGQVFINLITNAQKYCDAENPHLHIAISQDAGRVRISFSDNGTPISADAQRVIFEKFARLESASGPGAGLGLAICREIMARLGGDITFEADPDGNRFVVWLNAEKALAAQ
jgi:signal transduction histidine kinase